MRLPKGTKLNKMECGVIWAKRYVYHMANINKYDNLNVIDAYKCFLVEFYGFADNRLAINIAYDSFVSVFSKISIENTFEQIKSLITEEFNPFTFINNYHENTKIETTSRYMNNITEQLLVQFTMLTMREQDETGAFVDLYEYEIDFDTFCNIVAKNKKTYLENKDCWGNI